MKKTKILVLDDDPDIGTMIKMMLEYKGYTVTVSDRADQAAEAFRRRERQERARFPRRARHAGSGSRHRVLLGRLPGAADRRPFTGRIGR